MHRRKRHECGRNRPRLNDKRKGAEVNLAVLKGKGRVRADRDGNSVKKGCIGVPGKTQPEKGNKSKLKPPAQDCIDISAVNRTPAFMREERITRVTRVSSDRRLGGTGTSAMPVGRGARFDALTSEEERLVYRLINASGDEELITDRGPGQDYRYTLRGENFRRFRG